MLTTSKEDGLALNKAITRQDFINALEDAAKALNDQPVPTENRLLYKDGIIHKGN